MRRAEIWTAMEARAHFSDLIEKAQSHGPQMITRHRKSAVVVISAEEWNRSPQRRESLAEFLSKSPLANSGLQVRRLGFLAGLFSVPDDFDQMGSAEIEKMFGG